MDCPKCHGATRVYRTVQLFAYRTRRTLICRAKACRFKFETLEGIAQIPEVGEIGFKKARRQAK